MSNLRWCLGAGDSPAQDGRVARPHTDAYRPPWSFVPSVVQALLSAVLTE
jgi:hypothetical protein